MSIDHDSYTVIGFVIDTEDFFKPFIRERKEKFHMEDRYHPKTGEFVGQEKVIDVEAGHDVVFLDCVYLGPETLDECWSPDLYEDDGLIEAISEHLGANVCVVGDYYHGGPFNLTIEPRGLELVDGVVTIDSVIAAKDDITRIGKAIQNLGIDPGRAGVHAVINIS